MSKIFSWLSFLCGMFALFCFIAAGGYICNRAIDETRQTMKEIEKNDKCIDGFVYRRHTENVLYYQYMTDGKPVPCFKIEEVR